MKKNIIIVLLSIIALSTVVIAYKSFSKSERYVAEQIAFTSGLSTESASKVASTMIAMEDAYNSNKVWTYVNIVDTFSLTFYAAIAN